MPLITLDEAKTALSITTTTYDADLKDYIDGVNEVVAYFCGPTDETEVTETVRGCGAIPLTKVPVLALTSVVGDTWGVESVTTLRVNPATGVIRRRGQRFTIPIREDYYTIVYTAGRAEVPPALRTAARIILKHVWDTRRGSGAGRPGTGGNDVTLVPGLGYTVPNRALAFMEPFSRGPSVG